MKTSHSLNSLILARWAGLVLLLVQRSPVIVSWMSSSRVLSPSYVQVAKWFAPVATAYGTMHTATGASPEVVPTGTSESPAEASVGEEFVWVFRTTGHTARSYEVQSLPPGMTYPGTVQSGVAFITGTPTEAGDYTVEITGYRGANLTRDQTATFLLELSISNGELSAFDQWRAANWNGDDLEDANISGPDADPDGDGWTNMFEYGFGQDPNTRNTSVPFRTSLVNDAQGTALQIELPIVAPTDLDLRVDLSESLESNSWTDVTDDIEISNEDTALGTQTLRIPINNAATYARVRLEFSNESLLAQ